MNNKERARDLHYRLIEDFGLAGNHNAARDLIISMLNEVRDVAIDEAVRIAKEGHAYTPASTAHNIAKRIKELKE